MDNIKISIAENGTTTLATAGKYCDRNIEIEAKVISENDIVFPITGNCYNLFNQGKWDWVIEKHSDRVVCENVTDAEKMFFETKVSKIPFTVNFKSGTAVSAEQMFYGAYNLTEIPKLNGLKPKELHQMFMGCNCIREIPESVYNTWDWSYTESNSVPSGGLFYNCYSLRKLPMGLLEHGYASQYYSSAVLYETARSCLSLDEIVGMPIPHTGAYTSNVVSNMVSGCARLQRFTFKTPNGQPYIVSWKGQTLDFSSSVGYTSSINESSIVNVNSGITTAKRVETAAQYEALKNDPDWYALKIEYSRYNHDSAIETINSLPDTSAYLAANGGTNTVKFKGAAGSLTDGGAISNLTEEEIAVAAAKGWTVTLV
jgi:hypothetical protein